MTRDTAAAKSTMDTKEVVEIKSEAPKEHHKHPIMGEEAVLHPEKVPALRPGYARPVMIHRAIYGSFERFIG
jgi:threonyl-tRNA synthetase